MKPQTDSAAPATESQSIHLGDPYLAAFLAWLIPGAGHFYQRRWGKGGLFMVCILGTFFIGLCMGQGRVVYASWRQNDQRFYYVGQLGVGLPALPALVQSLRTGGDPPRDPLYELSAGAREERQARMAANPPKAPLWGGIMAPPLLYGQPVPRAWAQSQVAAGAHDAADFPDLSRQEPREYVTYLRSDIERELAPKEAALSNPKEPYNQVSDWNYKMGPFFELGSVYTLIAGLLNILAIYDAWGGPVSLLSTSPPSPDNKKPAVAQSAAA